MKTCVSCFLDDCYCGSRGLCNLKLTQRQRWLCFSTCVQQEAPSLVAVVWSGCLHRGRVFAALAIQISDFLMKTIFDHEHEQRVQAPHIVTNTCGSILDQWVGLVMHVLWSVVTHLLQQCIVVARPYPALGSVAVSGTRHLVKLHRTRAIFFLTHARSLH